MQVSTYSYSDSQYPDLLREINSAPKTLYVLGELPTGPCVAIVGTRHPTEYGRRVTYQLASELARAGITIISGLAYGLDTVAHVGALDAGGQTVAILAGGVEKIYPASNHSLAARIVTAGGALISENPDSKDMHKGSFAIRNRIISGLSLATIVTEASAGSGSLLTAGYALDQNRLLMAVPGNITSPTSAGPNNLIRSGATPVTSSADVLAALNFTRAVPSQAVPKSSDEAVILDLLKQGLSTSDQLIKQSQLDASQFANVITLMEITGKVRNLGAGTWVAR